MTYTLPRSAASTTLLVVVVLTIVPVVAVAVANAVSLLGQIGWVLYDFIFSALPSTSIVTNPLLATVNLASTIFVVWVVGRHHPSRHSFLVAFRSIGRRQSTGRAS